MSDDMAEKKPRGRPMKKGYPPRRDAGRDSPHRTEQRATEGAG